MKKVLITGSRGFIGSRFIETFRNYFNISATNSSTLDITDKTAVYETIESVKPDYVIHAAAIAETNYCNNNPVICRSININGTENIVEACSKNNSRLIFLSTEQVFNGNSNPGPYRETDKPVPDTEYGRNKLEAESYIADNCNDYVILRLTWLFGIPGKSKPVSANILWDSIKSIMLGKTIRVSENEYRGMTSIDELLENFSSLMELPKGIYHTGSENPFSRYETVCHIFREMGLQNRIEELILKDVESYSENPRDARLATSLLKSFGIRFSETPDALSRYIKEYSLQTD